MSDPALITNRMIWDEIKKLEEMVKDLYQRDFSNSTGIISMNKLCKRWGKGRRFIKEEIEAGRLKAKVRRATKRIDGEIVRCDYYSFALQDVLEYEKEFGEERPEEAPVFVESFDDTVKRIVNRYSSKK